LILGIGIPVLLFALLGGAFGYWGSMGGDGTSGHWQDYRSGEFLLTASERILVATYLDEETHEIPTVTADDGTVVGSVTERFRRFRIVEALKGDGESGDIMHVVTSVGYKTALSTGGSESYTYDVLDLTADEDYVLFLDGRAKQEGYPSQYGDTLWTRPGEPAIAKVDSNGRLTFIATDRYKDTIEGEGLERLTGSDAPFELTKEDITGPTSSR
jgi:hypothetical protein